MINLRDYQEECILEIAKAYKNKTNRQLISLPTGTGKTCIFSSLAKRLNTKTLILAHRDELLDQAIDKFKIIWPGVNVGKVKAEQNEFDKQVVVASVQSICRDNRLEEARKQGFKLCVIDEAHHAVSNSYLKVVKELGFLDTAKEKLLVGVTATPERLDKIALGELFQKIVFERTIASMIRGDYLADLRGIRIQTKTDISKVGVSQGDFQIDALASVVDTEDRNNIIVKSYQEKAPGLKSIAFCVNIEHSKHLAEEFNTAGIKAAAVWGDMDKDERKAILKLFHNGDIDIITNCNLLTEGFDEPSIRCLLMARPTKSRSLYIQMVGRGTRKYPNKKECLVIDFTDNRHDICMFGDLRGKPIKDGQSVKEAEEEDEKTREEAKETSWIKSNNKTTSKEFDLLETSNFRWFEMPGIGWRLPIEPKRYVFVKSFKEDKYYVCLENDGHITKKLSDMPLSLGYAQGVAEDYARKFNSFSAKDASWRKTTASDKQKEILDKLNVEYDENITKGQASDLIEKVKSARNNWKYLPATQKQIYFLTSNNITVRKGILKGEASKLIYELKNKEKCCI